MKKAIAVMVILTILLALTGCAPANGKTEAPAPESTAPPSPSTPPEPFALKVKTGETIHLGMSRDEAEAVAGAPLEEGMLNQWVYEGVILAYRDDTLVYILLDDERWNVGGAVALGMPTEEALEILDMAFEEENKSYSLGYFAGGEKKRLHPNPTHEGNGDYETMLTLFTNGTVKGIIMAEKQYALTMR